MFLPLLSPSFGTYLSRGGGRENIAAGIAPFPHFLNAITDFLLLLFAHPPPPPHSLRPPFLRFGNVSPLSPFFPSFLHPPPPFPASIIARHLGLAATHCCKGRSEEKGDSPPPHICHQSHGGKEGEKIVLRRRRHFLSPLTQKGKKGTKLLLAELSVKKSGRRGCPTTYFSPLPLASKGKNPTRKRRPPPHHSRFASPFHLAFLSGVRTYIPEVIRTSSLFLILSAAARPRRPPLCCGQAPRRRRRRRGWQRSRRRRCPSLSTFYYSSGSPLLYLANPARPRL